jgi:hypothetical protein
MLLSPQIDQFVPNPVEISCRLRARVSPGELFALGLNFSLIGVFLWAHSVLQFGPYDLLNYLGAGRGDFSYYYYGYWLVPLFRLLAELQPTWAYILWSLVNILGVFFAGRVFGGRTALAMLSFQMFYMVFIGQMLGLLLAGLGLLWWGVAHRRWSVAGIGLLLAAPKFQTGLTLAVLLIWVAGIHWREVMRILLIPLCGVLVSLALYPTWPVDVLTTIQNNPPNVWGNISLWQWVGPWALVLWVPPLVLRLSRRRRFLALAAASALALPYFQQVDVLTLFVFPLGWLPVVLGNIGYLFFGYHFVALKWVVVVPGVIYGVQLFYRDKR